MQPPVTGPQKAAAADNTGVDVAVDNAGDDRAVARVRLAGRDVAVEALRAHPDRFTALFGRARSEVGHAVCLCRTDPPVRLGRCRSGRYHLANWPDGGRQHDPSCPWYRSHSAVSGRSACTEAITTTDTGTSIRLSTPLIVRGASATPTSTPARARTGTSTSRGAMGPLALLHYLWESAQLNVWHPGQGQRTWRTCHTLLGEQTSGCRVNTLDLADTLWIVPPFRPEIADRVHAAWDRFLRRLATTGSGRRRGLVLGEIRTTETTDYGVRLRLAHQRAALFTTAPLMEQTHRSYPSVFSSGSRQVSWFR